MIVLIAAVVLVLVILLGLAALDREVPTSHVERALSNAS
jgi:hypothetical protein